MRKVFWVAPLLLAPLFLVPALAEQTYLVSKISIRGSKSVPTADLMAVVKEHPGERVTVADIKADMAAIEQVLMNAHVIGSVQVSAATTGDKSEIIFQINDQGIEKPTVKTVMVQPRLGEQDFVGNTSISSTALANADGLKPDEELTKASLNAAAKAIVDYYHTTAPKVGIAISTSSKQTDATHVELIWKITETAAKPASSSSDSSDQNSQ